MMVLVRHALPRPAPLFLVAAVLACAATPVLTTQTPPRDQAAAEDKTGTAVIRGQVIAADTGAPLSGVVLRAIPDFNAVALTGRVPAGAVTDDAGRFELTKLPAGKYMLFASVGSDRPLYLSTAYGAKKFGDRGSWIELQEGEVREKIVFPLPRAAAISGHVVNEKGEPIAWVEVTASVIRDGAPPASFQRPRPTDDFGRFRVFGLPPEKYVVQAEARDLDFRVLPGGKEALGYVTTFYPGALTPAEGQVFTLAAGQEVADIEITMRRARTYRVSGVVTGQDASAGRANVGYSRENRGGLSTSTNADGTFTFDGLIAGEYTFTASTIDPGNPDVEPRMSEPLAVNVDRDIDGLVLSTRPCTKISGHVVVDIGAEKPPGEMRVGAFSVGPSLFGPPPSALVKPDGAFSLNRVCGQVVVGLMGVPRSTRQIVTYKGKDITDLPTAFYDSVAARDLELMLTNKGSEITGQVTNEKSTRSAARVLVFPADQRRWPALARQWRVQETGTDPQGRFSVKPLGSGKYLIVALDQDSAPFTTYPSSAADVAKLASIATTVELVENEVREVSLAISKLPQ